MLRMSEQEGLNLGEAKDRTEPVECLGQLFESDYARREHYLALLAEKLRDPDFRKTPGFPEGADEAILRLSDPPYYTACPNPFLGEVIARRPSDDGADEADRTPYAADISTEKSAPIYNAHSYHTKVPPAAIETFIKHYTRAGDIVLDCFCGTGMTGVACADRGREIKDRTALLVDLSPLATHIAGNATSCIDPRQDLKEIEAALADVEREYGHLYETRVADGGLACVQEYMVWTEWFDCSDCGASLSFYDELMKHGEFGKLARFPCRECGAIQVKKSLKPSLETVFDPVLRKPAKVTRTTPVLMVCKTEKGKRHRRDATEADLSHIDEVKTALSSSPVPLVEIPFMHMTHERNDLPGRGVTHVHHFYSWRNLLIMTQIWGRLTSPWSRFLFTSVCDRHVVRRNRFIFNRHNPNGRVNGPLSNTLFVPPLQVEFNVFSIFRRKIEDLRRVGSGRNSIRKRTSFISTQSATCLDGVPDKSVDYVFVDPPFGGNILYSDLNVISESWLGVRTAREPEAVVDEVRSKSFLSYQHTMAECFTELRKKMKPGRWITVEFHNSSNAIWAAIQSALGFAGLVVADVRVLDKGGGTIHQDSKAAAVKKDLLISAYRPEQDLESSFSLGRASPIQAWAFISEHLGHLPIIDALPSGGIGLIADRSAQLLLDRMIGFFVQGGVAVPLGSADFFVGLDEKYPKRDGMYFLPGQVSEYDRKRTTVSELQQLELFVSDEASATKWIRQQLQGKPQTFQELQPQFMQQIQSWAKHEITIELKEILALNFLCYEGDGNVPSQIHNYLSTNFRELRNLEKDDERLKSKANDRWYVADAKKESDLEKLRMRTLLREFEEYRTGSQRKIKEFRSEAVRAGFKRCYDAQDYETIVTVAAKLPEQVIQEDEKLLMYYDVATMRLGDSD